MKGPVSACYRVSVDVSLLKERSFLNFPKYAFPTGIQTFVPFISNFIITMSRESQYISAQCSVLYLLTHRCIFL